MPARRARTSSASTPPAGPAAPRAGHRRAPARRGLLAPAALGLAALTGLLAASSPSVAAVRRAPGAVAAPQVVSAAHALVSGSGSSWAANAVEQWIADVQSSGLQVVFTSTGSAQGRKDFANNTVDYAVSDIGYQGVDPISQQADTSNGRPYAYLPVTAGGTAFAYQIQVGGQLVRNLRLSSKTLAKIFTNQITNWDDPQVTADNNGRALPSLQIIPVVHSEGSGSTYQFTRYLDRTQPGIWRPFGQGPTEYFPRAGAEVAANGSDSVMNFITSAAGNGAIGYDEYSYALGKNYPVAKVLNDAGYYTLPNQYNVAVALTQAQINTDPTSKDYLLQNLDHVYTYSDARTYPVSSYSYLIIPTSATDAQMTTAKRQTIADYLYYSVCQGQKEMGPIGYSPLPVNLVQAGFTQISKLHTADPGVNLTNENVSTCNNPTFIPGHPEQNYLAQIAPQPETCDKASAGPCTDAGNTGQANPTGGRVPVTTTGGGTASSTGGTAAGTTGTTAAGRTVAAGAVTGARTGAAGSTGTVTASTLGALGSGAGAASSGGAASPAVASGATTVDPSTGQVVAAGTGGTGLTGGVAVAGLATTLPAGQGGSLPTVLALIAALCLLGLLVGPPLAAQAAGRRAAALTAAGRGDLL